MQPTRLQKVQAHAAHLLDALRVLRAKYAMLEPMLFDEETVEKWGGGDRAAGFEVIRNTLLTSCLLDVCKIASEHDPRSPSLGNLVDALDDERLLAELEEEYSVIGAAVVGDLEPELIPILEEMEAQSQEKRRQEFRALVQQFKDGCAVLGESHVIKSLSVIRDKVLAHNELTHDGEGYRPRSIADQGLKYDDLKQAINDVQDLVDLAGLVFRSSSFAFDMLDEQLGSASIAFWGLSDSA